MKRIAAAALSVAAFCIAAPAARADQATCSKPLEGHYSAQYHAVRHSLGTRAPGRNIRKLGVRYRGHDHRFHVREAKCVELRQSLGQLRRLRQPPGRLLRRTAVAPAQRPSGTLTASVQADLPPCTWAPESGGDYHAYNASSGAGGKYQIIPSTWRANGGTGSPQNAPPAEQERVAARVYDSQGPGAWVNC